jgi:predicted nuclease with TOPRIM domain
MNTENFDHNLTDSNGNKNRSNLFYNITLAILTLAVIGLAWLYYTEKEKNKVQVQENVELNIQKDSIESNLENMIAEYESLQTTNDEVNKELLAEKERVQELLKKLRNERYYSRSKFKEYEKELGTLRKIMRSYIVQIDSLNQSNIALRQENRQVRTKYKDVQSQNEELTTKVEEATQKVEVASILRAINITAAGLNENGKERTRTKQINKFRACFTIDQNRVVEAGAKTIYLRIITPADFVMENQQLDSVKVSGTNVMYSAKRDLDYNNESIDLCIYYQVYETLPEGVYKFEIIHGNHIIGTSQMVLKKSIF